MKQPKEPNKEDCCNSGCNPCIFDVYEKQLRLYELYLQGDKKPPALEENAMSQLEYNQFDVIKIIDICKEHKLLLFKQSDLSSSKHVFWYPGQHFLIKYVSTTGQSCTRAYTPIKYQTKEPNEFAIIVKCYKKGLLSNYLFNLNIGEKTLWRGPYGAFRIDSNNFTRIVMVAQGTGIAPFYSIIRKILDDEENMTRLNLLYCCKCVENILLRDELYSLRTYWNFQYSIYTSKPSQSAMIKYKEPISNQRLTFEVILNLTPFTEKDLFLLCGSADFMEYYKKCLEKAQVQNIFVF